MNDIRDEVRKVVVQAMRLPGGRGYLAEVREALLEHLSDAEREDNPEAAAMYELALGLVDERLGQRPPAHVLPGVLSAALDAMDEHLSEAEREGDAVRMEMLQTARILAEEKTAGSRPRRQGGRR